MLHSMEPMQRHYKSRSTPAARRWLKSPLKHSREEQEQDPEGRGGGVLATLQPGWTIAGILPATSAALAITGNRSRYGYSEEMNHLHPEGTRGPPARCPSTQRVPGGHGRPAPLLNYLH